MSYNTKIIVFDDFNEAKDSAEQFLSAEYKVRVIGPTKEVELKKVLGGNPITAEPPGPYYVVVATLDQIGPVYNAAGSARQVWGLE